MTKGKIIAADFALKSILKQARTIAIVGLSPKPARDSHRVAIFLQNNGYRIIPVRPGQKEILGEPAFRSLDEIDETVDIVVVFRRSDLIMPHAQEALRLKPRLFWMQLGIENPEAARLLMETGIDVVMNRCIKIEHGKIFGQTGL